LYPGEESTNSQPYTAVQLINSVTCCTNFSSSRRYSVYEKYLTALKKGGSLSNSSVLTLVCIHWLELLRRPLILLYLYMRKERISVQVDNIKWLFEILGEQQMAEEYEVIWFQRQCSLLLGKTWFRPMLSDYCWLQRCKKGRDIEVLEESVGQALMLPMKHQHVFLMEWFESYSKHGAECPNLSSAFQIWQRRSFLRGSKSSHTVELEATET
ncbi:hypothetical protein MKW92_015475, partial [Papaver armeniacum]